MSNEGWLMFGAGGQLANAFEDLAGRAELPLVSLSERQADITDKACVAALIAEHQPAWVLNAAAYNAVDKAETDKLTAELVNGVAPGHMARCCVEHGARFIHVSTDYVFGTGRAPFGEEDIPTPMSAYGRSKRAGELAWERSGVEGLLIRTAWVHGVGGANFLEKILARAEAGESLKVVDDQRGCPTFAEDLAMAIFFLAREGHRGLFHVVNAGETTWYEFASEALVLAGLDAPIEPIKTSQLKLAAPRPADSRLSIEKLLATGWGMRPWQAALAHYLSCR